MNCEMSLKDTDCIKTLKVRSTVRNLPSANSIASTSTRPKHQQLLTAHQERAEC